MIMSMKYVNRQMEPVVNDILATFSSLALNGPRQSGKTTLLINTLPDYQYITLDDPVIRERALSDPRLFFDHLEEKAIQIYLNTLQGIPQYVR